MKKESTPVFLDSGILLPEKKKPEIKDLFEKKELTKEERNLSISRQLSSLNVYKISGLTEEIKKENFPDIPDRLIEDALFDSETGWIRAQRQKAGLTPDTELQRLLLQNADSIEKKRDQRAKLFLKNNHSETVLEPESTKLKPAQSSKNDHTGQYL